MEFYNILDLEIAYKEGFAKQFGVVKRLLFLSTSNISFVLKKKKICIFLDYGLLSVHTDCYTAGT